ncbi:MAG: hypothetical protein QG671_2714 [Actinomycetota bacterium]|nr:hypothetical protein [Actinomycetota bacterium]
MTVVRRSGPHVGDGDGGDPVGEADDAGAGAGAGREIVDHLTALDTDGKPRSDARVESGVTGRRIAAISADEAVGKAAPSGPFPRWDLFRRGFSS